MLDEAQAQADKIIEEAKDAAFAEVKRQIDEAQTIKANAENEAQKIVSDAKSSGRRHCSKSSD